VILSDKDLKKRIKEKSLLIKPFDRACVQPSTYDLHLSDEFRLFTNHETAGYIDPGFKGHITFEMSNLNKVPIILYPGMKVAQICFFVMSSKVDRPYGTAGNKYQGQKGPTESRVWKDFG